MTPNYAPSGWRFAMLPQLLGASVRDKTEKRARSLWG